MSTFTPGGRAQSALGCIAAGPVSLRDVRRALNLPQSKDGKVNALVENLRRDALVARRADGLHLTRFGREVLELLRTGQPVEVAFGKIVEGVAA